MDRALGRQNEIKCARGNVHCNFEKNNNATLVASSIVSSATLSLNVPLSKPIFLQDTILKLYNLRIYVFILETKFHNVCVPEVQSISPVASVENMQTKILSKEYV